MTAGRREAVLCFSAGLLVVFLAVCPKAYALNCNGRIVSEGDDKATVLVKCGEPATREERQEVVITREEDGREREQTVVIEEWTYNFGTDRLIQVLTFRNGALQQNLWMVSGSGKSPSV